MEKLTLEEKGMIETTIFGARGSFTAEGKPFLPERYHERLKEQMKKTLEKIKRQMRYRARVGKKVEEEPESRIKDMRVSSKTKLIRQFCSYCGAQVERVNSTPNASCFNCKALRNLEAARRARSK